MIYLYFALLLTSLVYASYVQATIIVTTIKGLMVGLLYNKDEFADEYFDSHTIQFCLIIVTITILWQTESGSE